mgnify:FL=1
MQFIRPQTISNAQNMSKEKQMTNTRTVDLQNEFDDALGDRPVMLTVSQVAELLNISRSSVFRLIKMGGLDQVKFNMTGQAQASVRIPSDSVRKLFISWVGEK